MIKYHNASNTAGKTINIDDVTPDIRSSMQFFCIGCGAEMTAVLGRKKEHHFRHKKDCACSPETYLHKYGKRVFKQRFDSCSQFLIQYFTLNDCPKLLECQLRERYGWNDCSSVVPNIINLKDYYDTCEEETMYKGFKADLMLTSSEHPERSPTFLEISVTHDCELQKIDSKIRIIEIKVQSESDAWCDVVENEGGLVEKYNAGLIAKSVVKPSPIRFYNFKRQRRPIHYLNRFYLHLNNQGIYNGVCKLRVANCRELDSNHEENVCFEVTISEDAFKNKLRYDLYDLGIALSSKRGFKVRNCVLCSRYGKCVILWEDSKKLIVYKCLKNSKLSSSKHNKSLQAWNCPKFKLYEFLVQKIIDSFKYIPYEEWSDEKQ